MSAPAKRPAYLLEWYRVDRTGAMNRALGAGAALMALGSLVAGASVLVRTSLAVRAGAGVLAFLCVVAGPLVALLGLRKPLMEELYVALRADGVVLHLEGPEIVVTWEDLEQVAYDTEAHALRLRLRSGEEVHVQRAFAGIDGASLARRMDECRRKAGFNLLR